MFEKGAKRFYIFQFKIKDLAWLSRRPEGMKLGPKAPFPKVPERGGPKE
jgi:hypothetical protein